MIENKTVTSWSSGIDEELKYWESFLSSEGRISEWNERYFADLFSHDRPVQQFVRDLIDRPIGSTLHFLDVGAGPATALGTVWPGYVVNVTAVDPLADFYGKIMEKTGKYPQIRTRRCPAESIVTMFGADRFDLVFAQNSLDHSFNPFYAIFSAVEVCKPGGVVFLNNFPNEAEREYYSGFHQWNFCNDDGQFTIWNKQYRYNMSQLLSGVCDVKTVDGGSGVLNGFGLNVVMRKLKRDVDL